MNDESELRELIKDHKHVCTECKVEFTVVWSLCVVPGAVVFCPACGARQGDLSNDEKN